MACARRQNARLLGTSITRSEIQCRSPAPDGGSSASQYLARPTDASPTTPSPHAPTDVAQTQPAPRPVRVFSEEKSNRDASRSVWSFFVADYGTLWESMAAQKLKDVHLNEVLEEDLPCHLYFDLEFATEFNPTLDGNLMVEILLRELERVLNRRWGLSLFDAFVMEMDASTAVKFSRHLIIRLRHRCFRNNLQIRSLIKEILHNASGAFVVQKEQGTGCFIDEAVYSRNRSFRMLWCTKCGKQNQLRPSKRFSLVDYTGTGKQNTQRLLFLGMIGNVASEMQFLEVPDEIGPFWGGSPCSVLQTARKSICPNGRAVEVIQKCRLDDGPSYYEKRATQLIPLVERLALFAAKLPATVNKVLLLGKDGLVSYNIVGPGSHFCRLVGRPHKRNHVYYLVDLQYLKFQQRCYDPDCDNAQAKWEDFPSHLANTLYQQFPCIMNTAQNRQL